MSEQASGQINTNTKSNKKYPDGQWENFYPRDIPCWININPNAAFTYFRYNRDEKEVQKVTTTWFEYAKHWIPSNKGKIRNGKRIQTEFICSSGPHMDKPCYGCAIRRAHFEHLDAMEQKLGARPDKDAPVSRSTQFALPITIMERMYVIPAQGADGTVKMTKNREKIYRYIPAPFAENGPNSDPDDLMGYKTVFGHRMHWSLGITHLHQLLAIDEELRSYCANCAGKMLAVEAICPACETKTKLPKALSGVDLQQFKNRIIRCTACGEKTNFVPVYSCPDCGEPEEGSLLSFDLRILKKKTGEKDSIIEVVGVRIPGAQDAKSQERIKELLSKPLELDAIYAPTSIKYQKSILGDEKTANINPVMAQDDESTETESYEGADTDDDDIPF